MEKVFEKNLETYLSQFKAVSLEDIKASALMDRVDTKFFFQKDLLLKVIPDLIEHCDILEIGGHNLMPYSTAYYDTENFDTYKNHHNRRANRYKFRIRKYLQTSKAFFEIKHRIRNRRTIKTRIPREFGDMGLPKQFIEEHSPYTDEVLSFVLDVNYKRFTLIDRKSSDRLTVDIDLVAVSKSKQVIFNNLCIVELKQSKMNRSSIPFQVLRKHGLVARRISKYCLGIASCHENIKSNLLKKKLRLVSKIENFKTENGITI